jgi:hypothetical protein
LLTGKIHRRQGMKTLRSEIDRLTELRDSKTNLLDEAKANFEYKKNKFFDVIRSLDHLDKQMPYSYNAEMMKEIASKYPGSGVGTRMYRLRYSNIQISEYEEKGTIQILNDMMSLDYDPPNNIQEIVKHAIVLLTYFTVKTMRYKNMSLNCVDMRLDLSLFKLTIAAQAQLTTLQLKVKHNPPKKIGPMIIEGKKKSQEKKNLVYKIYAENNDSLIGETINGIANTIHNIIYERRNTGDIPKKGSAEPPSPSQIKRYLEECGLGIWDDFRYVGHRLIKQT